MGTLINSTVNSNNNSTKLTKLVGTLINSTVNSNNHDTKLTKPVGTLINSKVSSNSNPVMKTSCSMENVSRIETNEVSILKDHDSSSAPTPVQLEDKLSSDQVSVITSENVEKSPQIESSVQPESLVLGRGKREKKKPRQEVYHYTLLALQSTCIYQDTNHVKTDQDPAVWSNMVYKLSIVKAIKEYGDPAVVSTKGELIQLIDKDVWLFIMPYVKISTLETAPIFSSLFLKAKFFADGSFEKLKSRLVAGGDRQNPLNYSDISASTISCESIFMIFAYASQWGAFLTTIDIGGAYLECLLALDDHVYVWLDKQIVKLLLEIDPKLSRFIRPDGRILVKLLKALYGTIQAARLWYDKLSSVLMDYGFKKHPSDPCVFMMIKEGFITLVGFHVDDILAAAQLQLHLEQLIDYLKKLVSVKLQPINLINFHILV